jgi:hypothetical protein
MQAPDERVVKNAIIEGQASGSNLAYCLPLLFTVNDMEIQPNPMVFASFMLRGGHNNNAHESSQTKHLSWKESESIRKTFVPDEHSYFPGQHW